VSPFLDLLPDLSHELRLAEDDTLDGIHGDAFTLVVTYRMLCRHLCRTGTLPKYLALPERLRHPTLQHKFGICRRWRHQCLCHSKYRTVADRVLRHLRDAAQTRDALTLKPAAWFAPRPVHCPQLATTWNNAGQAARALSRVIGRRIHRDDVCTARRLGQRIDGLQLIEPATAA
jgi:hypothetical protein